MLRWVSPLLFIGNLQLIAAGIGTSNFPRAAFIGSLSSSSFDSMKNIPLICLALSSFGFSMAHLWFDLFFAASDINFHISGHTLSALEVVCFLVSLLPDHVYPSGGLSNNKMNLVEPVHAFLLLHPLSSAKRVSWSLALRGNLLHHRDVARRAPNDGKSVERTVELFWATN